MPKVFCVAQAANIFYVCASIWSFSQQIQFVWPDFISCSSTVPCRQEQINHPYDRSCNVFVTVSRETLLQVSWTMGTCWLWWNALWVLMQFWFRLAWRLATSRVLKLALEGSKQSLDLNCTIIKETSKVRSWSNIVISCGTSENEAV